MTDTAASVLIIGAGVIGLAMAKWARFFGAGDIGISEMVPTRIARARERGRRCRHRRGATCQSGRRIRAADRPQALGDLRVRRSSDYRQVDRDGPANAQLVLVGTGMQPENFTVVSAALKRLRMSFRTCLCSERFSVSFSACSKRAE